jgi:hypothetical protein
LPAPTAHSSHCAQAAKLADEYDLVAKGKQALGVVGEIADTAIIKTVELEKEYKVRVCLYCSSRMQVVCHTDK